MTKTNNTTSLSTDSHWDALLRAPIQETECAIVQDTADGDTQIVVIYNARNAPPIVTIEGDCSDLVFTIRADGTPVAVLSKDSCGVPEAEDVVLVARHGNFDA